MERVEDDTTVRTGEAFVEVVSGELVVLSDDLQPVGAPVPIGPEPCIVGRGGHCQVTVADRQMSVSHFQAMATEWGICVTDMESLNGTWLNQVRVGRGHSGYMVMGGRLRAGGTWFDVRVTGREQVAISSASTFGPLVGRSVLMRELYAKLARIAPTELSVLISGETGTGKELVAHAIHRASRREGKPFVVVDCGGITASLAESTLFGHEKGAFTGAVDRKLSPFVEAKGGTVFLDEIGELPIELQPKLLRALETRQIQPVGSTRYQPIDVRVVSATHRDLHAEMNAKRFRPDLYHRLVQTVVTTPPLRQRPEDIPDLVASFIAKSDDPSAFARIDQPAMDRLKRHDWTGNVRELRNAVTVAIAHSRDGLLDFSEALRAHGGVHLADRVSAAKSYAVLMDEVARDYFTKLHSDTQGNISAMSRQSGLVRSRVLDYVRRFSLRTAQPADDGDAGK